MIESTDEVMAADIEAAIRAVPGVSTIFRTGSIVAKVVAAGAQFLGAPHKVSPLIRWERHASDGARVEAEIGVHAAAGAAETSRHVHEAITALCAERGYASTVTRLTIVHIDDGPGDIATR